MFHAGHARQFLQAKNIFPDIYLIVGACNDQLASGLKGRTVLKEQERYESLRHCRYVDEVLTNAPLVITNEFLQEHKIDFVAQDPVNFFSICKKKILIFLILISGTISSGGSVGCL